ncbi:MAG: DUF3179 domain-containing protein [Planctomycetales bacterium]|nr:DUF3179 domain-containing protein [Planctomycetales bacterium]
MYDRTAEGHELTFCVSGKLWNRSLVMVDTQTKTEWSHILGRGMKGKLEGHQLEAIPADMVTWKSWKTEFPETTVLALSRTRHRDYTNQFYRNPSDFVLGYRSSKQVHHCSFQHLMTRPVLNVNADDLPLVLTFDRESTSARIFHRKLDDQVLEFHLVAESVRDKQTDSTWDRVSGKATAGPMKGKQLKPHVAIPSYRKSWITFHPNSVPHRP